MMPAVALEVPRYEAPAPEASSIKAERLFVRVSTETKMLLDRASALAGRSMTDFVVETVTKAAVQTIVEHERIVLNERERSAFFEALLNPPTPSAKARAAARRSRQMFGE